jgi:soluble lytic murein transglycosylase-like protein
MLAALALAGVGGPALAQVIEIGEDGAAVTYAAPAVFTDAGAQPIVPPAAPTAVVAARPEVARLISEAAERNGLSVDLVNAVAWRESRFRQNAVSHKDAVGVMQLTAGTARDLGVDRYDLAQNIHGGASYLRQMLSRYRGDVRLALAAYNAGPGAVDRYRGVPPYRETTAYVSAILSRLSPTAVTASVLP